MKHDIGKGAIAVLGVWTLLWFGAVVGIIWAALHFILKFW